MLVINIYLNIILYSTGLACDFILMICYLGGKGVNFVVELIPK